MFINEFFILLNLTLELILFIYPVTVSFLDLFTSQQSLPLSAPNQLLVFLVLILFMLHLRFSPFLVHIGLATGRVWVGPPLPHSRPNYINLFPIPIPNPGWGGLMSPIPVYKRVDNPIPVPNVFSRRGWVRGRVWGRGRGRVRVFPSLKNYVTWVPWLFSCLIQHHNDIDCNS